LLRVQWLWRVGLAAAVTGCSPHPPAETERAAREYLSLVRTGDLDSAVHQLHRSLQGVATRSKLAKVRELLEPQPIPDSAGLVAFEIYRTRHAQYSNLTFESHRDSAWILANVAAIDSAGNHWVTGIRATPMSASLEALNAFRLSGKSLKHYVVLLLTIASVLFTLAAAVVVWRTAPTRRWIWAGVALLGIGRFGINWSTGDTFFNPLFIQVFGGGFFRPGLVGPWFVSFGPPAGAIYALWRVRQGRASRLLGRVPQAGAAT
jgi:hypothetical protein